MIYNTPNHRLNIVWTNMLLGINFTKDRDYMFDKYKLNTF